MGTSRLSADRGRHFRQNYSAQLAQEQVRKIKYIDLGKPKSGAHIFFPARLFNKTKAPTMDKVRGNINLFATSPCPRKGLIIR